MMPANAPARIARMIRTIVETPSSVAWGPTCCGTAVSGCDGAPASDVAGDGCSAGVVAGVAPAAGPSAVKRNTPSMGWESEDTTRQVTVYSPAGASALIACWAV